MLEFVQRRPRLALALIAFAAHAMWLRGTFLSDDFGLILDITEAGEPSLRRALDGFVRPLPGVDAPLPADIAARFWRPMWRLSLYLDLRLWGPRPVGFLLTNVALHVGCVVLLFGVIRRLGVGVGAAWAAAALFAVHPTHHEAVPWIAARCGPLAVLFSLLCAELLLASVQRGESIEPRRALAAAAALLAALLAKENALVFPATAGVLLLVAPSKVRPWRRLAAFVPCLGVFGLYLAARHHMLGEFVGGYEGSFAEPFSPAFWEGRVETMSTLLGPIKSGVLGAAVQEGLAIVAIVLLAGGLPAAILANRSLGKPIAAAAFWSVAALAPTWQVPVPPTTHESARYLYEPAAALCALLALAGLGVLTVIQDGARRDRIASLAVAAGLAVGGGLLIANSGSRFEAFGVARELFPQVRENVPSSPGGLSVFVDIPDQVDAAYVGRNALPHTAQPPFTAEPSEIKVFLDTEWDRRRFSRIPDEVRRRPGTRIFVWDPTTRKLRKVSGQ